MVVNIPLYKQWFFTLFFYLHSFILILWCLRDGIIDKVADSKTINIDNVGLVLFERSKRAKRISISIKPFRGVRVAVPYRSSFGKAEEFVFSKKAWIKKQLDKMKRHEEIIDKNTGSVKDIDRGKAKAILGKKLEYLAGKYGFSYKRVFIRNQKTRWGSCSVKNNISLNMQLIRLHEELIDYVILHELVHTKIKNHNKTFWIELDKLVGNGKQLRTRLKPYGMGLY